MARLVYVAFIVMCLASYAFAGDEDEKYPDTYDDLDVDAILADEKQRTEYYNCFLSTGPCLTPESNFFKERFAEVIVTNCRKCTDKQLANFEKIADWFDGNDPKAWEAAIKGAIEYLNKGGQM